LLAAIVLAGGLEGVRANLEASPLASGDPTQMTVSESEMLSGLLKCLTWLHNP
jgi:hypothetical protein